MVAYDSGDTSVRIIAAGGALTASEALTIVPAPDTDNIGPCGTWVLGPAGATFNTAVTVAIRCPATGKATGVLAHRYRIATRANANGAWSILPGADGPDGYVSGSTTHFSEFAVVSEPVPEPWLLFDQCGQTFAAGGVTAASTVPLCLKIFRVLFDEILLEIDANSSAQTALTLNGLLPSTAMFVYDGSLEARTPVQTDAHGTVIFNQALGDFQHFVLLRRVGGTIDVGGSLGGGSFPNALTGVWDPNTCTFALQADVAGQTVEVTGGCFHLRCLDYTQAAYPFGVQHSITAGAGGIGIKIGVGGGAPISNVSVEGCNIYGSTAVQVMNATDVTIEDNWFNVPLSVAVDLVSSARVTVSHNSFPAINVGAYLIEMVETSASTVSNHTGDHAMKITDESPFAQSPVGELLISGPGSTGNTVTNNDFQLLGPLFAPLTWAAIRLSNGASANTVTGNQFDFQTTIEHDTNATVANTINGNTFNGGDVEVLSGAADISQNVFQGSGPSGYALTIGNDRAPRVFLNDFLYVRPAVLSQLSIELSDTDQSSPTVHKGNYWNRPCCTGQPAFVVGVDAIDPNPSDVVVDSYAFGEAVATLDFANIPSSARCQTHDCDGDTFTPDQGDCDDNDEHSYPSAPERSAMATTTLAPATSPTMRSTKTTTITSHARLLMMCRETTGPTRWHPRSTSRAAATATTTTRRSIRVRMSCVMERMNPALGHRHTQFPRTKLTTTATVMSRAATGSATIRQ